MNNRTVGILTTSIAAILCGCPGILFLCAGGVLAFSSFIPGVQVSLPSDNDLRPSLAIGISVLCLGMILVLLPIVVGLLSLWNRPEMLVTPDALPEQNTPVEDTAPQEPIPPAN